jgi:hypothetical protein
VELNNVYPYLMPGLLSPEWEPITIPLGHGVFVTLFEDHESAAGIVHATVSPQALRDAGLSAEEAHRAALENLERFAAGDELSTKMLGRPGEPVNFLLFAGHARAAACLRLPHLYEQARQLLETDEICACVPQRESLIILPKRDRAYREMLVGKLREIEANARRPISFELFELTWNGVQPFTEP